MPPRLPSNTSKEVLSKLKRAGFYVIRQKGSHLQLKRGNLLVTLPMHGGDIPRGTLKSILRQAHLTPEEYLGI